MLQVALLLQKYQQRFQVAPVLSEEEVRHYLVPIHDVLDPYVVEGKGPSPPCWSQMISLIDGCPHLALAFFKGDSSPSASPHLLAQPEYSIAIQSLRNVNPERKFKCSGCTCFEMRI